jgi:hypothetical protein
VHRRGVEVASTGWRVGLLGDARRIEEAQPWSGTGTSSTCGPGLLTWRQQEMRPVVVLGVAVAVIALLLGARGPLKTGARFIAKRYCSSVFLQVALLLTWCRDVLSVLVSGVPACRGVEHVRMLYVCAFVLTPFDKKAHALHSSRCQCL